MGKRAYLSDLSVDYVRLRLTYDPETGIVRWRDGRCKGRLAGSLSHGYLNIGLAGRRYLLHRVVWLWMTGQWPTLELDHINGLRWDNRWCNLREVSHIQNCSNVYPYNKRV